VFLVAFLALAVASVPLLGGQLGRLADVHIRHGWAVAAALGTQIMIITVLPDAHPGALAVAHVASYLLAGYFLWVNRSIPGLVILGVGWAMNALVIAVNGGIMPAAKHLAGAGSRGAPVAGEFLNSQALSAAKLAFLGDNFSLPRSWPLHNVFSLGDIFIAIGAFVAVNWICGTIVARAFSRRRRQLPVAPAPPSPAAIAGKR
jgi:hypothetical protein